MIDPVWTKRSGIQNVGSLVIDKVHLIREEQGANLEAIFSCTRFISQHVRAQQAQQNQQFNKANPDTSTVEPRIVVLFTALASPADLANWMRILIPPTYQEKI